MILNHVSRVAEKCWREIPDHFPDAKLDGFVVIPNHIHGILLVENNFDPDNGKFASPKKIN